MKKKYTRSDTAPFGTWKCKECGQIFRTRAELKEHLKIIHKYVPYQGRCWNKGLTKETDSRVAASAATLSQKMRDGRVKVAFKGKHHTVEARLLMSKKRLQNIDSGKLPGRVNVKWYDVQNIKGEIFRVRGHWEENVAKKLNQLNIYWTKCKHYILYKLPDGRKKFYNPDFVIPQLNAFIEVKGWFDDKDKLKMNCVQIQHPDMKIYFINADVYKSFISDSGKLVDDYLYKIVDLNLGSAAATLPGRSV